MRSVLADKSLRELLRYGIGRLREAQVSWYTLAAELLLLHVVGRDRVWLYSNPEEILPDELVERFSVLLERRIAGEPTQHLTGKQEFWGLEFEVTPDVLIPRPETEHLIEVALDRLAVREVRAKRPAKLNGESVTLVDVGTGSGCIAIALAKELPAAKIFASDISPAALTIARRNAAKLGFVARIEFRECDLLSAFLPTASSPAQVLFDVIVSNPPYIGRREEETLAREVREHEPNLALFGGEEGYELYGPLVAQAQHLLKPEGLLVLELGHDSLPAVQPLLATPQWTNVGVTKDLAGIPRILAAEKI
ncbi:MAG: peptide chain release factor N(5)-glutamine methyltransferase [Candidatus Acidiferrum sp.]